MQPGRPSVSVGQHSAAGLKARNDDSFGVLIPAGPDLASKGIAMAIADGMSSSEAAKAASETCVKSFLEDYYATHESWTVKKSVGLVLQAANNWLYAQGQRLHQSDRGMVTTFSGLVLKSGTAHIFHAGDTRIALLRGKTYEPLTHDHRVHAGRDRAYLSRAFGINPDIEIDYRSETVEKGDVFVFTSDGVHEHVTPAEISRSIAAAAGDLDAAARAIADLALKNGSDDNLTCQIVRVDDPGTADAASHLAALTALPFPPDLEPGMTFEGYNIVRELHTSKRTQVYLARDTASGKVVVLKTPSVNFEDDATYLEMFTREEWIGRLVASPHVLSVLTPERTRRFLYYTTEYFDGQTLRQWMTGNPKPEPATVLAILEQIAKGLRAFHRKDVLHQDIKPENVMIDRAGVVKIIDFGSSRAASQLESGSPVEAPDLVGTIDYTAPEYHLGELGSNRSDIYSLGVIAYEMLTGKLPYGRGFTGPRDVAKREYIPARVVRDDIPAWVDAALAQAVAKKPSERTEVLSAFIENMKQPNSALGYERPLALAERNPLTFWKILSVALLLSNIALLVLLSR